MTCHVPGCGEPARLFATLQDEAFKPVAGAEVEGDLAGARGSSRRVRFESTAPVALTGAAGKKWRARSL